MKRILGSIVAAAALTALCAACSTDGKGSGDDTSSPSKAPKTFSPVVADLDDPIDPCKVFTTADLTAATLDAKVTFHTNDGYSHTRQCMYGPAGRSFMVTTWRERHPKLYAENTPVPYNEIYKDVKVNDPTTPAGLKGATSITYGENVKGTWKGWPNHGPNAGKPSLYAINLRDSGGFTTVFMLSDKPLPQATFDRLASKALMVLKANAKASR